MEKKKVTSERLDKLLVDRGLVSTRTRAQSMIIAGKVLVNDAPVTKPGALIKVDTQIRLREPELKYVSRGALKLKKALEEFSVETTGKIALDVGASTGGFTEVLLENGVVKVHTIDVGTNQLAWKIRSDPRVDSKENYNARYIEYDHFNTYFDLIVMDVSFISIKLIMPSLMKVSKSGTHLITLFKPQFEVGKEFVQDGGIVRDQELAVKVMENCATEISALCDLTVKKMIPSPIQGTDGNHEYLIHWIKN